MRILFLIKSIAHFPYVSSILEELKKNDAKIYVLFSKNASLGIDPSRVLEFSKKYGIITRWMEEREGRFKKIIPLLREAKTYSNYLNRKGTSAYYKDRWKSYLPFYFRFGMKNYYRIADKIENMIPPSENVTTSIKDIRPDVVVATPANQRFSEEIEYIKSAKRLNIPTVIHTLSWDNLTTKGLFHVKPDRLLVWNASQSEDAMLYHRIPAANIKITGSPFFDKWFSYERESDSKYVFCEKVGLNPKKPYFLYLGSSSNIVKDETWLIEKISNEYTNADILFRPHPANYRNYLWMEQYNIAIYPKTGKLIDSKEDQNEFYRSLLHASFVFGINTSAMLDAVINDKPCVTLICDKYSNTQSKTQHFNSMVLGMYQCNNFYQLYNTFNELLEGKDSYKNHRKFFIKHFIQPDKTRSAGNITANYIMEMTDEKKRR